MVNDHQHAAAKPLLSRRSRPDGESVTAVAHNRVTFYRRAIGSHAVQPIERFMKEYTEVKQ